MKKHSLRAGAIAALVFVFASAGAFAQQGATTSYNGHSYALFEDGISWDEAKRLCESKGGYLATITSRGEQKALAALLKSGSKKNYWVGGQKAKDKTGRFTWITGEKLSFTDWNTGAPSDSTMGNKNSMMVYKSTGRWCDENGDKPAGKAGNLKNYGFICEWDGDMDDYSEPVASKKSSKKKADDSGPYAIVMEKGDSVKLGSGTWQSSDTSVIKITKKGMAAAIGEGMATLSSSDGLEFTIKVEEE